MPVYKRVTFSNDDDHERVFSLLVDLIRHPQHASAMEEFVFDRMGIEYWSKMTDEFAETKRRILDEDVDREQEALLMGAIKDFGFDDKRSAEWLQSLRSGDPRYSAAFTAASQTGRLCSGGWQNLEHLRGDFFRHAAAVVLALCPNIHTLVYTDDSHSHQSPLHDFLAKNNYGLLRHQYLQKLHTVKILHNDDITLGDDRFYTETDFLDLLMRFHRLPSIHRVSINGVDQNNGGGFIENLPPAISDLKDIHIGHSAYGSAILGAILRVPKRLEQVTLTTGGRSTMDTGNNMLYPMTIGKALHEHKSSLQRLDIDLDEYVSRGQGDQYEDLPDDDEEKDYDSEGEPEEDPVEPDGPWWRDDYWELDFELSPIRNKKQVETWHLPNTKDYGATIGSLHDFTELTHLSIGIKFLLDGKRYYDHTQQLSKQSQAPFRLVDALPRSLKHFTIRGYKRGQDSYYDKQIDEFLAQRHEKYPQLVNIQGIEEMVPSSRHEDDPDDPSESHYGREEVDHRWEEVHH